MLKKILAILILTGGIFAMAQENVQKNTSKADNDFSVPVNYASRHKGVKYGKIKKMQYKSTVVGKKRNLIVYLPAGYTEEKKYPVLYLFHGLGQDETQWIYEGSAHYIVGNLMAEGLAKDMILVMPNCRARINDQGNPSDAFSLDNYRAFDNFINELQADLMPFIKENFSIKEGRENTACMGFSMGGRESLFVGLKLQSLFGWVGASCPAPGILEYTMNGIHEDGLFKPEEFKVDDSYKGKTLVMIVAGDNDTFVGTSPLSYHQALEKNNTDHIWYLAPGGHDFITSGNALYNFAKRIF